jgi:asparagine N-glycosylation enzyme membrane subunit Stt3
MKHFFNSLKPIVVLLVSYVLFVVSDWLFNGQPYVMMIQLVTIAMFFTLGLFLHSSKRKNQDWIKKVLISLLLILIVVDRLGIFSIQWLNLSQFMSANPTIINAFLVYLGWLFFE